VAATVAFGSGLQITYRPSGDTTQQIAAVAVEYAGLSGAMPTTSTDSSQPGVSPRMFASGFVAVSGPALLASIGESCDDSTSSFADLAVETNLATKRSQRVTVEG
jgi:hypothetical protein